jgi:hypothetical protein
MNKLRTLFQGNPVADLVYILAELNKLFKDKASRDSSQ